MILYTTHKGAGAERVTRYFSEPEMHFFEIDFKEKDIFDCEYWQSSEGTV
jgi:hypothetical protein